VNLDGLVNDREFFRRVVIGHDLKGYLATEHVGWLADKAYPGQLMRPASGLTADDAASIPMELVHSLPLPPGDILRFAFWRIQPSS
jgi:hypothetical protein